MIRNSDAVDVLVEALQRATELGLLLSHTKLHELLKYWAANQELAKIEEVREVLVIGRLSFKFSYDLLQPLVASPPSVLLFLIVLLRL